MRAYHGAAVQRLAQLGGRRERFVMVVELGDMRPDTAHGTFLMAQKATYDAAYSYVMRLPAASA